MHIQWHCDNKDIRLRNGQLEMEYVGFSRLNLQATFQ